MNVLVFFSFALGDYFGLRVVIGFGEFVSPMKERLSDDRRNGRIVESLGFRMEDFGDQVVAPSAFDTGASLPSSDLTLVIVASAALKESAVPLKPAIRVLLDDPAGRLPHF